MGRVRSYREWLGIESRPSAIQWLGQKLSEAAPASKDIDWDAPVEFVLVHDSKTTARTQITDAKRFGKEQRGDEESATGDADDDADDDVSDTREREDATSDSESTAHSDGTGHQGGGSSSDEAPKAAQTFVAALSLPLKSLSPENLQSLGYEPKEAGTFVKGNCAVSESLGSAKARLVCADELESALRLRDYLTQALPFEPLSSSPIHVSLFPGPLKGSWASIRSSFLDKLHHVVEGGGPTASLAEGMVLAVVGEIDTWVKSTDRIALDAGLNPSGELTATVRVVLRAERPWLIRSIAETTDRIREPPAPFLGLPAEVKSTGYEYLLPANRVAPLQSSLVALGRKAIEQYGPLSQHLPGKRSRRENEALDAIAESLLQMVNAPCFRTEYLVWGREFNAADVPQQKPVSADEKLRRLLTYQLLATPTAAECPATVASFFETLDKGYRLLPKAKRAELALVIQRPELKQATGAMPPARYYRLTLPRKSVDKYFADEAAKKPLGRAKSSVTLSFVLLSNVNDTGVDWLALGFDERSAVAALEQVVRPKSTTLRDRIDIGRLRQLRPITYSEETLGSAESLHSILPSETRLGKALQELSENAAVGTTVHLTSAPQGAELVATYRVPKSSMDALRALLHFGKEDFDEFTRRVNDKSKPAQTASGPVGIIRKK